MGVIRDVRARAARLREQATAEEWAGETLIEAIARECQVSLLAAHRHARGWTGQQVADELNELRGQDNRRITVQMVSSWERGDTNPGPQTLDLLCRLYQTRPDRLGFGADYSIAGRTPPPVPSARQPGRIGQGSPNQPAGWRELEELMPELDAVRRALGETLRNELSDTAISYLERRVRNYHAAFATGTSASVVVDVSRDLQAARDLVEDSHSPDVQTRLLTVIAQLAGMLGIAFLHMGDVRATDEWLHIGELAAEQAGDRELRGWITVRQALIPLYYGNAEDALSLADQALNLAGPRRATAAGARAATVRARVLAQQPAQRTAALAAADQARAWHAQLTGVDADDGILGLNLMQLASHLGEVYTNLGDTTRAIEQHTIVLDRFTGHSPEGCLEPDGCLDYTLTRLNLARCHIHDSEPEQGCVVAAEALLAIPAVCCTPMINQEARKVAVQVPGSARSTSAWRQLRDVLAFRNTHQ